ncbi:hypothetical protein DB346_08625 [Verrucomicrobia bacterium LW23]|nr:hypothetical protein DB346_08625 [Verrucomicrobia bacterium LW23]
MPSTLDQLDASKAAVEHVLKTIRDNPEIYYHLGWGTKSFSLLTDAYAAIHCLEIDADKRNVTPVHEMFFPDEHRMEVFEKDKQLFDDLRSAIHDQGLTIQQAIGLVTYFGSKIDRVPEDYIPTDEEED